MALPAAWWILHGNGEMCMHILVTAGPTREMLDPVRFLSNRSTGKMGFALAEQAAARGHQVTLVAGPVTLATPPGVRRIDVVSARDMLDTVQNNLADCDVLIMAAAVADWRPKTFNATKLKKSCMSNVLELEPNPDILRTIQPLKGVRLFIGFAAETGDPLAEAQRKLHAKGLDMIVANDVASKDAGFEVDTNRVVLIPSQGEIEHLPLMSKREVAIRIIAWAESSGLRNG